MRFAPRHIERRVNRRRLETNREALLRSLLLEPDAVEEREALWIRHYELMEKS